jgi:hypothetical protein
MTDLDPALERLAVLGRTPAPEGLLTRVLISTGTGYWYAQAPSPLGPVLVGHGPHGIAAVRLAADGAGAFEAWFRAEHGVVIRPEPRSWRRSRPVWPASAARSTWTSGDERRSSNRSCTRP